MKVRKATPADAPALVKLFAAVTDGARDDVPVDPEKIGRAVARYVEPNEDTGKFALLAEPAGGGAPVGALTVQRLEGAMRGRIQYLVRDVATAADHRREGVARLLLEVVERLAREAGCERIELYVPYVNLAALTLVARAGYRKGEDIHLTLVL